MRVLILGGTSEAMALAKLLAPDQRFNMTISLAGRTKSPLEQVVPARFGGFGGVTGLIEYLKAESFEAVIDATHPYAAQMSANAVAACEALGVPLISFTRPAWTQTCGDIWHNVPDYEAAVTALGTLPKNIFLSVGRLNLSEFISAPHHRYIARTIDPPGAIKFPPNIRFVLGRGPFDLEAETTVLRDNAIDVIVSKNSGGTATYAKIEAARNLSLPVIMIDRPHKPTGTVVTSPTTAITMLEGLLAHAANPVSLRGV